MLWNWTYSVRTCSENLEVFRGDFVLLTYVEVWQIKAYRAASNASAFASGMYIMKYLVGLSYHGSRNGFSGL